MDLKKLSKDWKIWLLAIVLVLSVVAIRPQPMNDGVAVKAVLPNSTASNAGISNPSADTAPVDHELITRIGNTKISSVNDYYNTVSSLEPNESIRIETSESSYLIDTPAKNFSDLGIRVSSASVTNIQKGLDLAGGSRVILKPKTDASPQELDTVVSNLEQRVNTFGLTDVTVRKTTDLSGENFVIVEIAGVTSEEVRRLVSEQGKFKANIGNETVFTGSEDDISHVCKRAQCSGLNPQSPCSQTPGGRYRCSFFFEITLSPNAAEKHARVTEKLNVITENGQNTLEKPLDLYLDGELVDSLQISPDLKGQRTTRISITGSGNGTTRQQAQENTLEEMKSLQTILETGSLPVEMEVVQTDTISPALGAKFLQNILLVGVVALIAVASIIAFRYRDWKIAGPMIFSMLSEIVMILGFASLAGWNIDLSAVAGIIVAIGTGVDDLVIITSETIGEQKTEYGGWKKRLKHAMFIVFGAYFTVVAGMIPLLFAGAGLLKGFALTTIAGVSFGVFVSRPAYASIIENITQE